jgi:hypothetical protein
MSDQALLWKFAFGALVLVFSAVTYVGHKEAEPTAAMAPDPVRAVPVPVSARAPAPAPAPLPAASLAPQAPEPTPADLPDAQETPVRIHIAMDPPQRDKGPSVVKVHKSAKRAPAPKLHLVHVTPRPQPSRTRHASPYAAGRQHYPFDPRERWRTREG